MKLIDTWQVYHKRWSVWLVSLGTTLTVLADQFPQLLMNAWMFVPADMKAAFDPSFVKWLGIGCLILSLVAGIIKQRSLQNK